MRGGANPVETKTYNDFRHLVVDTSLFSSDFQSRLLSALSAGFSDGIDAHINGTLIHSDNFQALNLLQARYREQVKCIYIDPPYNTSASEIIYKNGYKHSSWLSLIHSRILLSKNLMQDSGNLCVTIDDMEVNELCLLLNDIFNKSNQSGIVPIRSNPSGRPSDRGFALTHEYGLFYGKSIESMISRIARTDEQLARFNQKDEKGIFEYRNLRREGSNSDRIDGQKQYYPIFANLEFGTIRIPNMEWIEEKREWNLQENPLNGEIIIYPNNDEGREKNWRWSAEHVKEDYSQFLARVPRGGQPQIYYKYRPKTLGTTPLTLWMDSKYSATEYGTRILKQLFNSYDFSYPKSIYAVMDSVGVLGAFDDLKCIVLDYFAGSGTTAHAVINLNREDNGNRQYILVEQGEYFDTVLKPRVQKVIYSENWKDGKPVPSEKASDGLNGVSQIVKVLKLESYEDTLNNLALRRSDLFDKLPEQAQHDYLLHYMLDIESRGSLLNVSHFTKPFDYGLNISTTSAGAYAWQKVDLVETFNYLLGATVISIDDKRSEQGFVAVECRLPNQHADEKTLIFWRDCERVGYDELQRHFDRLGIHPADSEYGQIYLNGDHTLETVWDGEQSGRLKILSIEDAFLSLMFEGDA